MNKVICDICGTAYPETSSQCPICGCAKGEGIRGSAGGSTSEPRTYVKGGRYSKKNVKKRNKAAAAAGGAKPAPAPRKNNSNRGLMIVAVILLLAILAMIGYLLVRFYLPGILQDQGQEDPITTTVAPQTTDATEETEPKEIPCTNLALSSALVELDSAGASQLLSVTAEPADTTDTITFVSSDEAIVTVTENGLITAVAPGQAVITITCGEVTVKCRVVCSFEIPTEPEETEPEETEPTYSTDGFTLNRSDITMQLNEQWELYNGIIPKNLITWYSDNEAVAIIENGKVTAVGAGTTTVYGEYNGVKVSCIIRCNG